jgi:O-antigen/teichoic acid export membrane protein
MLAKLGYNTTDIGIYELFFFIANVLSFFWTMGLKNGLISYYPALEEAKKSKFFFNLLILLLTFGLIAGLGLYLLEIPIAKILNNGSVNNRHEIQYLGLIILYLIFSGPGNFTEYYYLLKGKNKAIVKYGVVIFAIQLLLIIPAVVFKSEIIHLLQLMVVWAAIKLIWNLYIIFRNEKIALDFGLQRLFLIFSIPLILHMLLGNGMEFVDGFIVNYYFDESIFAKFRFGARELPLVSLLAGALSTAMIPEAVKDLPATLAKIKISTSRLMNSLFPLTIVLILISPFLFPLVYNQEFALSARIFNIYLLVISSRLLMPQVIIFAKHENRFLLFAAAIEFIINISLSLILLEFMGITGIVWATVVAYLVNKLMLYARIRSKYQVLLKDFLETRRYFFWLFIMVISYYISTLYS